MELRYLPVEIIHIILQYDGRIKYRNGMYINIIYKYDIRYMCLYPWIEKIKNILDNIHFDTGRNRFLFDIPFENEDLIIHGLLFDYNFTQYNTFQISYYRSGNITTVQFDLNFTQPFRKNRKQIINTPK